MDQELIAYLDQRFREVEERLSERFRETSRQIEDVRAETAQQIAGLRDETSRHTQKVVGAMREEVHTIARGILSLDERMAFFREDMESRSDEVKALLRRSCLEIERRTDQWEAWRSTRERDPVEVLRERYGNPPPRREG